MNDPLLASPVVHGGLDHGELRAFGLKADEVLDFSSSVNPLGPAAAVREAIARVDLAGYPDRECLALREAISERTGAPTESILPGNGSTELMHLIAATFLPGRMACIFAPAFGEYAAAARLAGAGTVEVGAKEEQGFAWDLDEARGVLAQEKPAVTFLACPNNPTGLVLALSDVATLAEAAKPGLLVLDEAYMPLADAPWETMPLLSLRNVLLLRSMTKDHGLAGVRLGYVIGRPAAVLLLKQRQVTWSVSAVAQAAGVAALNRPEHVARGRQAIAEGKHYLSDRLTTMGLAPCPSGANFLLLSLAGRCPTRESEQPAAWLRRQLLQRGILVRDCASFGLPQHVRISVRRLEDCVKLMDGIAEVVS